MENNSIREFTCNDCQEVTKVDWSKVRPDIDDGTSNIEIHEKGNGYAYYGECMNCGNLVEIEPPVPELVVDNVDVDKNGMYIQISDVNTCRSCWIEAWQDKNGDWEYDFNQYIFHLDNENDIVAKMFQEDLGNYAEDVFDCVMSAINEHEEEYNKLQESKAPTMRDRLKEAIIKRKGNWTDDYIKDDLLNTKQDDELWKAFTKFFRGYKGYTDWTDEEIDGSVNEDDVKEFIVFLNDKDNELPFENYITADESKEVKTEAKYSDGYFDDLPEEYPEEIRNKYYEYVAGIDLIDDEPLDFITWVSEEYPDITAEVEKKNKKVKTETNNKFKTNVALHNLGIDNASKLMQDLDIALENNDKSKIKSIVKKLKNSLSSNDYKSFIKTYYPKYKNVLEKLEDRSLKTEDTTSSEFNLYIKPEELSDVNISSLLFDSDTVIADYKEGNYMLSLIVRGDVKIYDNETGYAYKNYQDFPVDLQSLIKSGALGSGDDTNKYTVDMNNWFEWFLDVADGGNIVNNVWNDVADIEGMLNKPTPEENETELEVIMKDLFDDIVGQLNEGKKIENKTMKKENAPVDVIEYFGMQDNTDEEYKNNVAKEYKTLRAKYPDKEMILNGDFGTYLGTEKATPVEKGEYITVYNKIEENVNIEISEDGKEVEVTTDDHEEVEVKNETPDEDNKEKSEDEDTEEVEVPEEDIDELEENKEVKTEATDEKQYEVSLAVKGYYKQTVWAKDEKEAYAKVDNLCADADFGELEDIEWEKSRITTLDESKKVTESKTSDMDTVDIVMELEGGELTIKDVADWKAVKDVAIRLQNSQGFYGRLLRSMEETEDEYGGVENLPFPITM